MGHLVTLINIIRFLVNIYIALFYSNCALNAPITARLIHPLTLALFLCSFYLTFTHIHMSIDASESNLGLLSMHTGADHLSYSHPKKLIHSSVCLFDSETLMAFPTASLDSVMLIKLMCSWLFFKNILKMFSKASKYSKLCFSHFHTSWSQYQASNSGFWNFKSW